MAGKQTMSKAATTARKPARCKPDPKPTLDEYRMWWHRERRIANELRQELALARATIAAQAYSLAFRATQRPETDDDVPF